MSHKRVDSATTILSILSCSSDTFSEFYEGPYMTNILVEDAKKIISRSQTLLQEASQDRYRLDELLLGMLDHAPDQSGQRYVAVVLHIAILKGVVAEAARAWLDYLFFPMLALSKANKTEPSTSQTPNLNATAVQIGGATRSEQGSFRADIAQIATREQYRCAVTQYFDFSRAKYLINNGRGHEAPRRVPRMRMQAAHIIPFSLNKFDEKDLKKKTATYTWDMLRSWTGINISGLVGSQINSPENGIYMNDVDHSQFGSFLFYFDKDEEDPNTPHKYKVQMARPDYLLANGEETADVEFLANTGVSLPNPQFLKVHAAFAKVLARSEAAAYMERVEINNERGATSPNMEADFATLLSSKLLA